MRRVIMALAALGALTGIACMPAAAETRVIALSDGDEAAYRAAFEALEAGDFAAARAAAARAEDSILVDVVDGVRFASPRYRPSYDDISSWLRRHGDLAVADAVYDRAIDIRPRRARMAQAPSPRRGRALPGDVPDPPGDTAAARAAIDQISLAVGDGDLARARAVGERALLGPRDGEAAWWLGIVAFRERDHARAVQLFEQAATWPYFGAWVRSGGYYWAARSRLALGDAAGALTDLDYASRFPATFYGQLALSQLGREPALNFERPALEPDVARSFLDRYPAARRAAALVQVGRLSEAEQELRVLHGLMAEQDDQTYLALATALRLPAAQLRAAEYGGPELAAGNCPVTAYAPENGFLVDRSVLFAIIRQESRYHPRAVSRSNARGLMQLLASTANDMDQTYGFQRNPTLLYDPDLNMRLGQDYVLWLIREFHHDGDLMQIFAAYNGGPGWLDRWLASQLVFTDPLVMLESIPRQESRIYAERVLSHMGLCRRVFGQPTPELDALASGQAAIYVPIDPRQADR
ncbi:MAG: transglycosylase SLT domain-containing protein [Caulobacterales bacterium]